MADIHLLKQHSAYKPNLPNSIKCVLESHTGHRTLSQMTYSPTLCPDTFRADANGGFELLLLCKLKAKREGKGAFIINLSYCGSSDFWNIANETELMILPS